MSLRKVRARVWGCIFCVCVYEMSVRAFVRALCVYVGMIVKMCQGKESQCKLWLQTFDI